MWNGYTPDQWVKIVEIADNRVDLKWLSKFLTASGVAMSYPTDFDKIGKFLKLHRALKFAADALSSDIARDIDGFFHISDREFECFLREGIDIPTKNIRFEVIENLQLLASSAAERYLHLKAASKRLGKTQGLVLRNEFIFDCIDVWRFKFAEDVGYSNAKPNEEVGKKRSPASGPLIKWLQACAQPIFGDLTGDALAGIIEKYKEDQGRNPSIWFNTLDLLSDEILPNPISTD